MVLKPFPFLIVLIYLLILIICTNSLNNNNNENHNNNFKDNIYNEKDLNEFLNNNHYLNSFKNKNTFYKDFHNNQNLRNNNKNKNNNNDNDNTYNNRFYSGYSEKEKEELDRNAEIEFKDLMSKYKNKNKEEVYYNGEIFIKKLQKYLNNIDNQNNNNNNNKNNNNNNNNNKDKINNDHVDPDKDLTGKGGPSLRTLINTLNNQYDSKLRFLPFAPRDFINPHDPTNVKSRSLGVDDRLLFTNNVFSDYSGIIGSTPTPYPTDNPQPLDVLENSFSGNNIGLSSFGSLYDIIFQQRDYFKSSIELSINFLLNEVFFQELFNQDNSLADQVVKMTRVFTQIEEKSLKIGFFYIANNGTDSEDCGTNYLNPCKNVNYLLDKVYSLRIGRDIIIFFLPGLHEIRATIKVEYWTKVQFVGLFGSNSTTITMPVTSEANKRIFFFNNTHIHVIGLTFSNTHSSESKYVGIFDTNDFNTGTIMDARLSIMTFLLCSFKNNSNINSLGTLFVYSSNITISNSNFENNVGGIGSCLFCCAYSTCIVSNSTIRANIASNFVGGGVVSSLSTTYIDSCQFVNNKATLGSGVVIDGGYVILNTTTFTHNIGLGGTSIQILPNTISYVRNCYFYFNLAVYSGASIFIGSNSIVIISLCRFTSNFSPGASSIESYSEKLVMVEESSFIGVKPPLLNSTCQISVSSPSAFIFVRESSFSNHTSVLFSLAHPSILYCLFTKFTNNTNRIVNSFNNGLIVFGSCEFMDNNNKKSDGIFRLNNLSNSIFYDLHVENNSISSLVESWFNSTVFLLTANITNNEFRSGCFQVAFSTDIFVDNVLFMNNTCNDGCLIQSDQTGGISVTNSILYNNTADYGNLATFRDLSYSQAQCKPYLFANNSYVYNHANVAGAIVYYVNQVVCEYNCLNCLLYNNSASFGSNINSGFDTFTATLPNTIPPSIIRPIIIQTYDHFDQPYLGRTDISFALSICPEMSLTGVLQTSSSAKGISVFYNVRISGAPGTHCNLTVAAFTTSFKVITRDYPITVVNCVKGQDPYNIGGPNSYYCLTDISKTHDSKILIGIAAIIVSLLVLASAIMTFIFRKRRIIRYSNPLFLSIIIVGCIFGLISVFVSFHTSSATCTTRMVLIPLFIFTITSAVFIKQYRVFQLIRGVEELQDLSIENSFLIKIETIILAFPVILIIVSGFATTMHKVYTYDLNRETIQSYCYSKNYYIIFIFLAFYEFSILLSGCFLVIKCRKYRSFPGTFNEFFYIGILIYILTLILIITIPIGFSLNYSALTDFLVYNIPILVFVVSILGLLFAPKFYFLFRTRQVIDDLRKLIDVQEEILKKNKQVLFTYGMYLDDNRNDIIALHESFSDILSSSTNNSSDNTSDIVSDDFTFASPIQNNTNSFTNLPIPLNNNNNISSDNTSSEFSFSSTSSSGNNKNKKKPRKNSLRTPILNNRILSPNSLNRLKKRSKSNQNSPLLDD